MWYTDPKCHPKLTLNYQAIESLFQEVKFYSAELHVDSDKVARISEFGKTLSTLFHDDNHFSHNHLEHRFS